ncbi:MAG: hypothetical protein CALGDGBN_02617 [Pseudomonadales bacterium]|nr:hypothetical protein [Pseudomonadales bacterium]
MVEAMITVLVLSVGMLAIASLQATAKRSTHQAWQRSLAVSIADSIVERIRINPSEAAAYHTGLGNSALGGGTITDVPTSCRTNNCTPEQVVEWDLWRWEQLLDGAAAVDDDGESVGGLIQPRGCIVFEGVDAGAPNTGKIRIFVTWQGLTETSDAVQDNVCGTGNAGTQASRRQVIVSSYVIDEGELNP